MVLFDEKGRRELKRFGKLHNVSIHIEFFDRECEGFPVTFSRALSNGVLFSVNDEIPADDICRCQSSDEFVDIVKRIFFRYCREKE